MTTPSPKTIRARFPGLYRGTSSLPGEKRQRLLGVLAVLVEFRDRLAISRPGEEIQRELLQLPAWIEELYAQHEALRETPVPRSCLLEFADGLNLELVSQSFRDEVQFRQYARQRYGAPGLMIALVLGAQQEIVRQGLGSLATAWGRVQVLRDLQKDLSNGRSYIPQDILERFSINEAQLLSGEGVAPLIRYLCQRAREEQSEGESVLQALPSDGSRTWAVQALAPHFAQIDRFEQNPSLVTGSAESRPRSFRLWPFRC